MTWLSSFFGSISSLPSPLKVKQEHEEPARISGEGASPIALAARSHSRDSWNTGTTEAFDLDVLSPPSVSSKHTAFSGTGVLPELVPQRLDLESRPCAEGAPGLDLDPQHVVIDRPVAAGEALFQQVDEESEADPSNNYYSHKNIPKYLDFESWSKFCNFGGEPILPTTWMVRNVPNTYSQLDLMAELDDLGFAGAFNFLYMPVDKSSKASVGYAFVNFIAPSWAARFAAQVQGHKFTKYGKNKEASVSVAHMQGLAANLAYYERCALKSSKAAKHQPLVLAAEEILPLPR